MYIYISIIYIFKDFASSSRDDYENESIPLTDGASKS